MAQVPHWKKRMVIGFQNGKCAVCESTSESIKLTADHLVPRALGGTNDIHNLLCLCLTCNSRKADKHPLTWLKEMPIPVQKKLGTRIEKAIFRHNLFMAVRRSAA